MAGEQNKEGGLVFLSIFKLKKKEYLEFLGGPHDYIPERYKLKIWLK